MIQYKSLWQNKLNNIRNLEEKDSYFLVPTVAARDKLISKLIKSSDTNVYLLILQYCLRINRITKNFKKQKKKGLVNKSCPNVPVAYIYIIYTKGLSIRLKFYSLGCYNSPN